MGHCDLCLIHNLIFTWRHTAYIDDRHISWQRQRTYSKQLVQKAEAKADIHDQQRRKAITRMPVAALYTTHALFSPLE